MNLFNEHQALLADQQVDYKSLLPLHHEFEFQNIPFGCEVDHDAGGAGLLMILTANLGFLPYSSENIVKRAQLLKGLGPLIARGQVTIDHHCSITMQISTIITEELDAKALVEAITYTLLDNRDALDQITRALADDNSEEPQKQSA